MKRLALFILFLFVSFAALSQEYRPAFPIDTLLLKRPISTITPLSTFSEKNEQAIPQDYYAQHLGFFCRQELKMQQAHVPVTFRLGSMDYCNWLEQKPGYR